MEIGRRESEEASHAWWLPPPRACEGAPPRSIPGTGGPRGYPLQPRPTQRKKNSMPFSALLHRRDSDMSSNFADILDFVY